MIYGAKNTWNISCQASMSFIFAIKYSKNTCETMAESSLNNFWAGTMTMM